MTTRTTGWWQGIINNNPQLATDETKTQIEAALARYRNAKTARKTRKGKSPWAFDYEDAAKMKMRLVEWLRDFQAYIPKGRWRPNKPDIRQIVGDLPVVVEYLAWLENQA